MHRTLDVYLLEAKAGVLEQDDTASLTFTYNKNYLMADSAKAVSVSMPLRAEPYPDAMAKPCFSGLLPDESARTRLAAALGVSDNNAFGMLEIIGGDCAGALALFPQDANPAVPEAQDEVLDEQQLADLLQELSANPLLGGRQDVRLSLAGAQDKIAVKVLNEKITLVKNGEPTTHILKPCIQGLTGTAQNEVFCMTLATRMGLHAPDVRYAIAGDTEYILVKRFDRSLTDDKTVKRLHQEDFCQALSVPPELKYEGEGGPGIEQSLTLIQDTVDRPAADRLLFLKMQIFHYLVGNADAHAKNFALLHSPDAQSPSLAPLYDVVCTAVYPQLTKKLAMRIGGRNVPDTIKLPHWLALMPGTRAAQQLLIRELSDMAQRILPEAEALLGESAQSGFAHPLLQDIAKVIKTRARQVLHAVA